MLSLGEPSIVYGPQLDDEQQSVRPEASVEASPRSLRLMTYNIQTGIETSYYRHYLTRSWRHFLPDTARRGNLDRIAQVVSSYDLVGLQEVDGGSLRSGFVNQVQYLSERASFPFWYSQTNRNLGKLAQHSNGLLSRYRPLEIREHKLPGRIPGRGAMVMSFGGPKSSLAIVLVHLALGQRTRLKQIEYLSEFINSHRHVIVMGDFNCLSRSRELEFLRSRTDLAEPIHDLHTFPSWRPQQNIDHILVSPTLKVVTASVLDYPLSDHLPVTMHVTLPDDIQLVP